MLYLGGGAHLISQRFCLTLCLAGATACGPEAPQAPLASYQGHNQGLPVPTGRVAVESVVLLALNEPSRLVPAGLALSCDPVVSYPFVAIRARIQGSVIVEGVVAIDGSASQLRMTKGVVPILDQAALDSVRGWRFSQAAPISPGNAFVATLRFVLE